MWETDDPISPNGSEPKPNKSPPIKSGCWVGDFTVNDDDASEPLFVDKAEETVGLQPGDISTGSF